AHPGTVLGDLHLGRLAVDVVGNQRDAGPDGRRSGAGMHLRRTNVGRSVWIGDVLDQVFEAAPAHPLQLTTLRPAGRLTVVIHGDMELFPQPSAEHVRQADADIHGAI